MADPTTATARMSRSMSDERDERILAAIVEAVTRGAHERDVAIQFGVTVEEVRAILRRTAVEVIGVEGVERERLRMLDRLDGLEAILLPRAAAGDEASAELVDGIRSQRALVWRPRPQTH
jgi:hypothetical protein